MKKLFVILLGTLFSMTMLYAQSPPQAFSFKAIINKTNGAPVVNRVVNLRVSILPNSIDVLAVYSETFFKKTNNQGQIDIEIGRGTNVLGSFSTIEWSSSEYFLKTEVDINGGTKYELISVTQLFSVPYALYAGEARSVINEKQALSLSGNQLTIGGVGGNTVTFTDWDTNASNDVIVTGNQTIDGNKTFTGIITVPTPVNATDIANKAYVDSRIVELLNQLKETGTFTDSRDEHVYKTVRIGTQTWMAENLAYLPSVNPSSDGSFILPKYYVYGYQGTSVSEAHSNENYGVYGVLYNWLAAQSDCPAGWHLPSDVEWKIFEIGQGMTEVEANTVGRRGTIAGKLKESGTAHWYSYDTGATNESGFTALPAGERAHIEGDYIAIKGMANFWTTTVAEEDSEYAWYRQIETQNDVVHRNVAWKSMGFSVRCLKD